MKNFVVNPGGTETDPLSLHLDQTTPQTIINGAPLFNVGLKSSKIYPSADSTTAVQINKADGTTNVLNVDTTNGRVGIGVTPLASFHVNGPDGSRALFTTSGSTGFEDFNLDFMYLSGGNGTDKRIANIKVQNQSGGGGSFQFQTAPSATGAYATKMTLDRDGKLGIGLSPSYLLDVNGDVNIAAGSNFKINGMNLSYSDVGAAASNEPLSLHLDQTTPQTVTGEIKVVNSGTINRGSGLISSLVVGSRTRTYSRNASGFVISMTDGTNTWTYTRDANNNVTSWAVT